MLRQECMVVIQFDYGGGSRINGSKSWPLKTVLSSYGEKRRGVDP